MKQSIRALIVEDSEFDARILVGLLRQGGYSPIFERVETPEALKTALSGSPWEIILCDYNLPAFNAPEALQILRQSGLDIPFIIISGGIGEDIAVAAMKAGAHDYLMKGNLARLVPAVERELRDAASRRARRLAEEALRESEQRNRLLWENSADAVVMMDPDGCVRFANPAVRSVFGREPEQLIGQPFVNLVAESARESLHEWIRQVQENRLPSDGRRALGTIGCHRERREVFIEIAFAQIELQAQPYLVAFIRDITERRLAEEESRLLQMISLAVNTAPDLEASLAVVLKIVCETAGWTLGQAWLPSADGAGLECGSAWFGADHGLRPFRMLSERLRLRPGEGLPGMAWQSRHPIWKPDISQVPNSPRASVAHEVGIVAGAGIPVLAEGRLVAVIEFFLRERRDEDERMVKLFAAIAAQLGVAIERKRGELELRANEEEFRAARDIQERLFPKAPPRIPGFDVAGASQPASAAGGDYFDFLPTEDGRWGIAIGDVTGHGIGPALLMAETRAYLRALARSYRDAGEVLSAANRVLAEDIGAERFITMLLVNIDPAQRMLTFGNAGHPSGFLLDSAGTVKLALRRTGVPLGIRADTVYPPAQSVPLESGDLLLMLTDGIDEAMAPDNSLYGTDRTLELVRASRHLPAREIVQALYASVRAFTEGAAQLDDATVVLVKVL